MKSTARNLSLMTFAPLLLVASALWWQKREAANHHSEVGQFRLTFERAEVSPITVPKDVADGYDTQVKIILNYSGARPKWWKTGDNNLNNNWKGDDIFYVVGGKALKLRQTHESFSMVSFPLYDETLDRFVCSYKLPLSRVPISEKPVVYKTSVCGEFERRGKNGFGTGEKLRFADVPISVELRGAGEETVAPNVSHETSLRFVSAKVTHLKPDADFRKGCTQIDVAVQNLGEKISSNSHPIGVQFVGVFDRNGIEYSMSDLQWGDATTFDAKNQIDSMQYKFPLIEVPSRVRPLFARFKATRNGSWPLGFSVCVRP